MRGPPIPRGATPHGGRADAMSDPTKAGATPTDDETKAAEEKAAAEAKAKADAEETAKLGDAGKRALDAEREARATAERAAKDAAKELAALRKEKADREAAAAKAADEKAKQDGEWERLATEREAKLASTAQERDALKATIESYDTLLGPLVKERLDAIKAANADVAKGFPADAPLLAQMAWLDDPRTKAVIGQADKKADALRGWVNTAKPNATPNGTEAEAQRLQRTGKYAI